MVVTPCTMYLIPKAMSHSTGEGYYDVVYHTVALIALRALIAIGMHRHSPLCGTVAMSIPVTIPAIAVSCMSWLWVWDTMLPPSLRNYVDSGSVCYL